MSYLMAGQRSERERLRLQSRIWEPAGERLLTRLGDGAGLRALDVGCGAMGWLRVLSRWVGPTGAVVGTDVDDRMLDAARDLRNEDNIANVDVVRDDFFASTLPVAGFDLVHLPFQLAPLGRATEQVAIAHQRVRPGGWLVLEDPDSASWRENPSPRPRTSCVGSSSRRSPEPAEISTLGGGCASTCGARGSSRRSWRRSSPWNLSIPTCDCRNNSRRRSDHTSSHSSTSPNWTAS